MHDNLQQLTDKKQKLDSYQPLPTDLIQNIEEWLKVELTYASNAIEGNTLSRLETAEVIEKGISAVISGKPLKDQLEARNHAIAVDFIRKLAGKYTSHQFIIEGDIKAIHKHILTSINDANAGVYRNVDVFIRGADVEFPQPNKVPPLMKDFVRWLQAQQGVHPVRVAADAHFKYVTIHPHIDGNGRSSRLLMNLILLINGYPLAIIKNEERDAYLEAIYRAQTRHDMQAFYAVVEGAVDRSLDVYLSVAKGKSTLSPITEATKPDKNMLRRIGDLAKATGETVATLRFWTKEGLLEVVDYTPAGYQLYTQDMLYRVKDIRHLQDTKRLTLAEIKKELGIFNC